MAGDGGSDRVMFDIEFDAGLRSEINVRQPRGREPRAPPSFAAETRQREQVCRRAQVLRGSDGLQSGVN